MKMREISETVARSEDGGEFRLVWTNQGEPYREGCNAEVVLATDSGYSPSVSLFLEEHDLVRLRDALDNLLGEEVKEPRDPPATGGDEPHRLESIMRERDNALAREAAIIRFCECEMGWGFFRAEMNIGDNPTMSERNALKLREFLEKHKPETEDE